MERSEDTRRARRIASASCGIALLALGIVVAAPALTTTGLEHQQAQAETPVSPACAHVWQDDLELVHHEGQTREVHHEAETVQEMVAHTLCNTCGEAIDGATAEHARETGHESYTTGVPTTEMRVASEPWIETVVERPASDELITVSRTCALCGEVREVAGDE